MCDGVREMMLVVNLALSCPVLVPCQDAMPEAVSIDPEKFLYGSVISRNWSWFPVVERLAFQGL